MNQVSKSVLSVALCLMFSSGLLTGCSATPPLESTNVVEFENSEGEDITMSENYGQFYFDVGSSVLVDSSSSINEIVKTVYYYAGVNIHLSGHADASGGDIENLRLSEKRVLAVYEALKLAGVTDDRIKTDFFGDTKPICGNETHEGRACNRSVVVYLVPASESN